MKKAEQLEAIDEMLREPGDVNESAVSFLQKVSQIETMRTPNNVHEQANDNFLLLKRLIKELQFHKNTFLRSYNLEVF